MYVITGVEVHSPHRAERGSIRHSDVRQTRALLSIRHSDVRQTRALLLVNPVNVNE